MQSGNNIDSAALIDRLERAGKLLVEAIGLAKGTKAVGNISKHRKRTASTPRTIASIDFTSGERAFIKRHGGGMNGQQKFALLLAYLAKGDSTKHVSLEEVKKHWNKMTAKGLLGMKFNIFYSTKAKEHDWVKTEKNGLYHLRPSWKDIFNEEH